MKPLRERMFWETFPMKYSIIFMVDEESDEFSSFFDWIYKLFEDLSEKFEVLVVANGTENFVMSRLNSGKKYLDGFKVIAFPGKVPLPICLKAAVSECTGTLILTLGPCQELSFSSYKKLIHAMKAGVDFVVPYRRQRKDAFLNRLHSRALNMAVRWVLGISLNDIGCDVRFFRREVLESLEIYGNMFRYFPALAVQKGFTLIEVECEQSEKVRKTRYYEVRLYLDRLIEILTLFFSTRFSKKPLRFFNLVGASFMFLGLAILFYVGFQRLFLGMGVGTSPLLIMGTISLVGGVHFVGFGLLGEIISFVNGRFRPEYTIAKII